MTCRIRMIIVRGSVLFSLAAHGLLWLIDFTVNCYRILGIEGSSCSPFMILVDFYCFPSLSELLFWFIDIYSETLGNAYWERVEAWYY